MVKTTIEIDNKTWETFNNKVRKEYGNHKNAQIIRNLIIKYNQGLVILND